MPEIMHTEALTVRNHNSGRFGGRTQMVGNEDGRREWRLTFSLEQRKQKIPVPGIGRVIASLLEVDGKNGMQRNVAFGLTSLGRPVFPFRPALRDRDSGLLPLRRETLAQVGQRS